MYKKHIYMMKYFLIIATMVLTLGIQAQDKKATKVLDKLSEKYDAVESIAINFDLTIDYPDREPMSMASSVIQAGDRWVFKNKQQELYNDGLAIWMFLPERNEVQINDYDKEEEGEEGYLVSPLGILKQYKGDTYKYRITAKDGWNTDIEFKPTDEFSDYAKFRLSIDTKKNEIIEVVAFGKDASKATIVITDIDLSPQISDELFIFDASKHPDVIIEDLRM